MSLLRYLIVMTLATLLCWAAFGLVIFYINPKNSGLIGFISFYLSLFLAMAGTASLVGFLVRAIFVKKEALFRYMGVSLRQAILFSVLLIFALLLLGNQLFRWWNVILLILALALLEFFFLTRNPSSNKVKYHEFKSRTG